MTKYIITIPKPCHEKWEEMTLTEKGRYCTVCKKEIYDFTGLSNQQLVSKLENNERVCAKYLESQLNVDLFSKKNNRLANAGLIISLTTVMAATQPAYSHPVHTKTQVEHLVNMQQENPKQRNINHPDSLIIQGVVMSDSVPVPGVTIVQKGTENLTVADIYGKFKLTVLPKSENEKIILQFIFVGMQTKEVEITHHTKELHIEMEPNVSQLMGEVVVVRKKNIFHWFGDLFRKKKK